MGVRPGYEKTEAGIIPEGWEEKSFGHLFEFRNGVNADKASYGQGVPFINVLEPITYSHIYGPEITGQVTLPESMLESYEVRRGDVLFNRTSETQEEVGLAATYLGTERVVFGGFVICGRPKDQSLDPIYSGYALRAQAIRSQIIPMGQGAIRANIGQHNLRLVVAHVPPPSEQRAIGSALRGVDALVESLEGLIAKKRDLKQAAMHQLLTGQTRLRGFSGKWTVKRLHELGEWTGGMTPSMQNPIFWQGGSIPWASSGDVKSVLLRETGLSITATAIGQRKTTLLPANSIIVVTRSGILRKYLPVAMNVVPMAINQDIKGLIPREEFSAMFLLHALIGSGNKILASCMKAGTTVESVEYRWLRAFKIPVPPITEQVAIAAVLTDMDAEIEALEQRLTKTRDLKQAMMQELLTGRIRLVTPEACNA
jgi:type I restriction enzyme S subunit